MTSLPFTSFSSDAHTEADLLQALSMEPAQVLSVTYQYGLAVDDYVYIGTDKPESGVSSLGFYDGSISELGGTGLILSTGSAEPGIENSSEAYSYSFYQWKDSTKDKDPDESESSDFTRLGLTLGIEDEDIRSLSMKVVLASDEYPEFTGTEYADLVTITVNDETYLSSHEVFAENSDYIRSNTSGDLPVEYDGVSEILNLTIPVQAGSSQLDIFVADSLDNKNDTALILSDISVSNLPAMGIQTIVQSDADSEYVKQSSGNQRIELKSDFNGDVIFNEVAGDDVLITGDGFSRAILPVDLADISGYQLSTNGDSSLVTAYGQKYFVGLDHIWLNDAYVVFDTRPGGDTHTVYSMYHRMTGNEPGDGILSQWVSLMTKENLEAWQLGNLLLDYYQPGLSSDQKIALIYEQTWGRAPEEEELSYYISQVETGVFRSEGDLLYQSSLLEDNQNALTDSGFTGSLQVLNPDFF